MLILLTDEALNRDRFYSQFVFFGHRIVCYNTRDQKRSLICFLPKHTYMVIAILEPVFAVIMVSLINKYVLGGSCSGWLQQSCAAEQVREDEKSNETVEDEGKPVSATNTTRSDADIHVHCH